MKEKIERNNNKKNFAIIAIIAVIAVAATVYGIIAYFTASDSKTNTFVVGNVSIRLDEGEAWAQIQANGGNLNLEPNQEITKEPKIINTGRNAAYVYLKVRIPKAKINANDSTKSPLFTYVQNTTDWDILEEDDQAEYVERTYWYKGGNGILNAGAETGTLFNYVKLANLTWSPTGLGEVKINVNAYAIQADNLNLTSSTAKAKAAEAYQKYLDQEDDLNSATVTFYDEDGQTVLGTSKVKLGTNASYTGSIPTKAGTQQYTYTFSGWDDPSKLNNVTEDRSVRAVYTSTTNKYVVTFYDENGTTQLGTSEVDYGTNASFTGTTPEKAADSSYTYTFAGWYTSTDANATQDDLSNVIANRSVYAKYTATEIPVPQGTTIGGRSVSEIIAQDGYAGLYGTQVKYQNKTFRVFYVEDSSNKFGEGEGTIYLKADQITTKTIGTYENSTYTANAYNSSKTVIRTVNPEWAEARGTSESSWQVNEKAAAYLCDPTVGTWSTYIDQTDENVNWVIGAPSAEMYMKSYAQSHSGAANYAAKYFAQGANSNAYTNGYLYTKDGTNYKSLYSGAIANDNAMYRNSSQYWWLASPPANSAYNVCSVYGNGGSVYNDGVDYARGVCPLVSLKSGVTLELVD